MIKRKCHYINCQNETNNPKYCSLKCGSLQQNLDSPRKHKPIARVCSRTDCNTTFVVEVKSNPKKFCSRSCSAQVNNTKFPKRVKESNKSSKQCEHCSQLFTPWSSKAKYCSSICAGKAKADQIIQSWLNGDWDGTVKYGLSPAISNYLKREAGYRCQSPACCVPGGWSEVNPVTGRVPVEVEHIDGDAYNNVRENLVVLCPNCHSLTATYRALNQNGSRKYRKDYPQFLFSEEKVI